MGKTLWHEVDMCKRVYVYFLVLGQGNNKAALHKCAFIELNRWLAASLQDNQEH